MVAVVVATVIITNHVPNRNTSFESNGPDVKLRGNAQQLHETYMALAHDAGSAGERISAEAYTQFADHYFRLHQAAVGVAETKRQQDQATATVSADATSDNADNREAGCGDASTGGIASEGNDTAPAAVCGSGDVDDAKPTPKNGRQNGKTTTVAEDSNAASKATGDSLSPAQLAQAVQDKAVAS